MTRILLVEDNDDHAEIITKALSAKKGWTVTRAITVKEGLLHAALKQFDIAILDYRLPDGDGIDLLDSLRAQRPGLPVVFLTAHGSEDVAMQAMSRGASDYVSKGPHYQKDLAERVTEVLARSEDLARVGAAVRHSDEAAPRGPAQAAQAQQAMPKPAVQRVNGGFDEKTLTRIVTNLTAGPVRGAAVFDGTGKPIAAKLPAGVDAAALGAALVGTQYQAQHALRQLPGAGPPRALLTDFEDGLLAVSAVPGPALVVLLMDGTLDRSDAVQRVRDAAQQVWKSSRA
ncbi:MAG TPA: response regulator [Candidatus Thermoplasmatota archaeon]|jgi:DNA-binding response OmpR family regulator|nr:response regulator [Candidatus Thermoplasmatota archaeon]